MILTHLIKDSLFKSSYTFCLVIMFVYRSRVSRSVSMSDVSVVFISAPIISSENL